MAAFHKCISNAIPSWLGDGVEPRECLSTGLISKEQESRPAHGAHGVLRSPLLAAVAGVLVSACSLFPQKDARVARDQGGVTVVTYPAEMRGAYIVPGDRSDTVCSEPAPDVALSTVADISGKLSANVQGKGTLDAQAAAKVTSDAIQLAGRSQIVLVSRDLLYSLCSVSRNSRLNADQIKDIYVQVTKVITALANAENNNAKARLQESINAAHVIVKAQADKVAEIVGFLTDGTGTLIKGQDGKYTKLEELFAKIDKAGGPKLDDRTMNRLRRVQDAADMRHVLLDVTPEAIDPLFNAIK